MIYIKNTTVSLFLISTLSVSNNELFCVHLHINFNPYPANVENMVSS